MSITFQKATKRQLPARIALDGPTGAGKTWSGLVLATELGKRICWIDTERRSASLYADHFDFDTFQFDPPYDPSKLVDVIRAAEAEGYDVIGVDSLSHFWEGEGGTLEIVDGAARGQYGGNKYAGWAVGGPALRRLVDTMLGVHSHLVVTMRSKMEYVETTKPNGSKTYEKVGMAPIMRAGIEYEFTLVGDMDLSHTLHVSKSRCDLVTDKTYMPGAAGDLAKEFKAWLEDGEPVATAEQMAQIKAAVTAPADPDVVREIATAMKDRFGPAGDLLQSRFEEALAFAHSLVDQHRPAVDEADDWGGGVQVPPPGEADPTNGQSPSSVSATSEPEQPAEASSDEAEVLLIDVERAIKGLPRHRQQAARDELRKTFGELSASSVTDLRGALDVIKTIPVDGPEPDAPKEPDPPLSAKQRQLMAYARGKGVDGRQLVALAAMAQDTAEPRPIYELNAGLCLAVQALIDRVESGEVVFETPNGVMVAKEVQPA